MKSSFWVLILSVFFVFGCAETNLVTHVAKKIQLGKSNETTSYKVGSSYKIDGKRYHPKETFNFEETGIASWYGPNFHGKSTANGERFDQNALTAAHRTLQIPSIIQVTNLENGRSLTVRVNDRGPFSKGRILDLSKRGAELLGFKNKGTARIRLKVLPNESRLVAEAAKRGEKIEVRDLERIKREGDFEQPLQTDSFKPEPVETVHLNDTNVNIMPVTPTNLYVQAGAFTVYNNAYGLAQKLQVYGPTNLSEASINNQTFYRVRIGPLKTVEEADTILNRVWNESGMTNAHIVVEEPITP